MKVSTYTNTGNRKENQDFILCRQYAEDEGLFIVADGMGGYEAGDVAAAVVAEAIAQKTETKHSIDEATCFANNVLNQRRILLGIKKMGCAIAGISINKTQGCIFWAGDVRVYLVRDGGAIFTTSDHSLVNDLLLVRKLTPKQIEKYGHILSRAIMGNPDDTVDKVQVELISGDQILICSDGFHKECDLPTMLNMGYHDWTKTKVMNDLFEDNHSAILITI